MAWEKKDWEKNGLEGLLHHPDGSPNIAAYG